MGASRRPRGRRSAGDDASGSESRSRFVRRSRMTPFSSPNMTPITRKRARVQHGGERPPVRMTQIGRDQVGHERQHRDRHQQQQVEDQDRVVGGAQPADHRVVVDPDDPDRQERHDIGRVLGPVAEQRVSERVMRLDLRDVDPEHQQRDRDREHAVRERLEPVGRHRRRGSPGVVPILLWGAFPVEGVHPRGLGAMNPGNASRAEAKVAGDEHRRRSVDRGRAGGAANADRRPVR